MDFNEMMHEKFAEYLKTWQPTEATMNTHGWDGWYVSRGGFGSEEVYFAESAKEATKKWAIEKAKELNA